MEKNKILRTAQGLCQFLQGLLIFFALLFTVVLIHWHFSPEIYQRIEVSGELEAGAGGYGFRILTGNGNFSGPGNVLLSELAVGMLYWMYLRIILFTGLTFLMVRSVRDILSSIQSLETFRNDNVVAFRKIGRYAWWIFVLSSFNFRILEGNSDLLLTLALGPLLIAVFAYVMAEVFREGNRLMEDNHLTI